MNNNIQLTAGEIKSNFEKLISYIKELKDPRMTVLLNFHERYDARFSMMPGSYLKSHGFCYPGGYVHNIIELIEVAKVLSESFNSKFSSKYTYDEMLFVCLSAFIGKFGTKAEALYVDQKEEWKRKKGETYEYNNNVEYMTIPDRSIYILNNLGLKINNNEYLAIKTAFGSFDHNSSTYIMSSIPEARLKNSLPFIIYTAYSIVNRISHEREFLKPVGMFDGFFKEVEGNVK